MPTFINGRSLGVESNGSFTQRNTDPIPGGRLWPEAALTWNAMRRHYIEDGGNPSDFAPAGPNSSARGRAAQDFFWNNQPPPAARPYTSNHGWAIAVDVRSPLAAAWMQKHASKFGWSHDEGARVGEWWHWRYVGASKATLRRLRRKQREEAKYRHLGPNEERYAREYDKLIGKKGKKQVARRKELRRAMTRQRKAIWTAAQKSGWSKFHRRERYKKLMARTT
jgi:hypothetical protein